MGHAVEIIGRSFQRGQNASERFADKLGDLRREFTAAATGLPILAPTIRAMRRTEAVLRRPLRLAVIGESNSGKSTLTNLLLGVAVLPTLQLSNTRVPTLIRYGREPSAMAVLDGGQMFRLSADGRPPDAMTRVQIELPLAPLRACEIVDFPGFFDPLLDYDGVDIARHRIDAAVWCTFSTQAWKESESAAWRRLPLQARKYGLLAVTNKDRLRDNQAAKVLARLENVARSDFQDFALLSSLEAQLAFDREGAVTDRETWRKSGAAELHRKLGRLLLDLRLNRLRKAQTFIGKIIGNALQSLELMRLDMPT